MYYYYYYYYFTISLIRNCIVEFNEGMKMNFNYLFFGRFNTRLTLIGFFITFCFGLNLFSKPLNFENCLSDYHQQQKKIYHNIPKSELNKLDSLIQKNKIADGWRLVGSWGDPYAKIAANVLEPKDNLQSQFYQTLIQNHWINTNGEVLFKKLFSETAKQHFKQYVEILKTGFWPDSDQILMSYLNAVRIHKLPDLTVFDAAWDAAQLNHASSWQSLNHLPQELIVYPTHACFDINSLEAQQILIQDFADIPMALILD